jgi:hypothetical protein
LVNGAEPAATIAEPKPDKDGWISLFDGKSLEGWQVTKFGGQVDPVIEKGQIILPFGSDMTGITWKGKVLKDDYEIELDAMRVDGTDFFCGLTFPVKEEPCTLICGGWGGGTVGLSSINGEDASENETNDHYPFKNGQWYHIRLKVSSGKIMAWIDQKKIIDFQIGENRLSVRSEVELSKPLGIATWCTTGAVKNIRMRKVKPGA